MVACTIHGKIVECVKKSEVEKHKQQCRKCLCLSCLDCGKEFRGEEYQMHLRCIKEKEKYGGKDYDANQVKGNAKQSRCIEQANQAIESCRVSTKALPILQCLLQLQRIPLKRKKYDNYLQNSMKVTDCKVVDEIWNIISVENSSAQNPKQMEKSGAVTLDCTLEKNEGMNQEVDGAAKLNNNSKRERKRKKKEVEAENDEVREQEEKRSKKKKQKSEDTTDADGKEKGSAQLKGGSEDLDAGVKGEKFNWKSAIKSILQEAEGNQMSAKKLSKKFQSTWCPSTVQPGGDASRT
uniref:cell growth-regulating nucleolar protein-like n=1 Tax=Myxine glutinosa TaxID=7769 RepID=UPI00358E5CEF